MQRVTLINQLCCNIMSAERTGWVLRRNKRPELPMFVRGSYPNRGNSLYGERKHTPTHPIHEQMKSDLFDDYFTLLI